MRDFPFDAHIFREGETYVGHAATRQVEGGVTDAEARRNIRDAVRGFLAASADFGTLDENLTESGYELEGDGWRPPEFVSVDHLATSMK